MRHHAKLWTVVSAGLLTAAMTGTVFAQAPRPAERESARGAEANAAQRKAGDENANAANEGPGSRRLISHALYAVINGSDLHFAAQSARGGPRHQDAANRPNDNEANRANAARQPNENNANDGNRQGQDDAARQRGREEREHVAQQLQQQADRSFQAGEQMLRFAEKGLGAENGAAEGRDAWSRRLYTAANQYADSLRTIAGADAAQANRSNNAADRNNENNGQDRDQARVSRVDAARVVLINQAVKESLVASEMRQAIRTHGANRPWAQHLQERAQQIATESDQLLQQVIADAAKSEGRQERGAEPKANNDQAGQDQAGAANRRNEGRGDAQGRPSIQTLAQNAQQVVQTLERIGAGDAQPNPAEGAQRNR